MSFNAEDTMNEAAVLLNDANKSVFNSTVLFPYLKKAYAELQDEFTLHSIPLNDEISSVTTIAAGNTIITSPSDMLFPIKLEEKAEGANNQDFRPMKETKWEPTIVQTEQLRYWDFRENTIYTVGSTANRQVLVYYVKGYPSLNNNNTPIVLDGMKTALAAKTAELVAATIGGATDKVLYLANDYMRAKDRLIGIYLKSLQSLPIRRRPYGVRIR